MVAGTYDILGTSAVRRLSKLGRFPSRYALESVAWPGESLTLRRGKRASRLAPGCDRAYVTGSIVAAEQSRPTCSSLGAAGCGLPVPRRCLG